MLRAAWLIDQDGNRAARNDVAMIKVVVPRLQTTVLSRAMQVYGAMGLTPTRRLPSCGAGAARCSSSMARTRCTCAPWRAPRSARQADNRPDAAAI